jgi:acyl-CoA reductase-like NAD-dependent aldehyde dehydrogenase
MATMTLKQQTYPMLIGGEWVTTNTPRTVTLPYDGTSVGTVYDADAALVERAINSGQEGAVAMASLTQYERAELLEGMRILLERDAREFADLICLETGKPIREARVEAERATQTLRASADEARRLHGEAIPMESAPIGKGRWGITVREPVGVIGAITPFNVPLNLALHKIGPAFAGGNSIVHKPATNTPLSALRLARLIREAGAPVGAYNVVTGEGVKIGRQLVQDPRIAMITFTGSLAVGQQIRAAMGLRRVTLELGGNSSVIIEPETDLDTIVPRCVVGSFSHSGQICVSVQNIYIHEHIADEFSDRFLESTSKLKIGHPIEEGTDISSLISEQEAKRVESWITRARAGGGRVLVGGGRHGATVEPTVLTQVGPEMDICCKEVFGPVAVLHRYRQLEDAVAAVNASEYGLQVGLCTRDIEKAFKTAKRIQVGGVILNDVPTFRADHMPYGGVKNSGVGREGPRYAVEEMTELKLICWRG